MEKHNSCENDWHINDEVDKEYDQLRLLTVLATSNQIDGTHIQKILDKLQVPFCELSNLSIEDFVYMGLQDNAEQFKRTFEHLPNQSLSYEEIYNLPASEVYNERIFLNAHNNLNKLHRELLLSYKKMYEKPPKDLVIGEKNYASKFLIEAFTELEKACEDVQKELNYCSQIDAQKLPNKLSTKKFCKKSCMLYSTLTVSIAFGAFCIWKLHKT